MPKRRLLIVDDQADVGLFIQGVAQRLDYEVAVTNDSTKFSGLYDSFKPDTVILDIFMPEMDGIEAMRKMVKRKSQARLLFISGADDFFLSCAMRLAWDFGLTNVSSLKKPISVHDLRSFLAAYPVGNAVIKPGEDARRLHSI